MPVTDDRNAIGERGERELDAVHDFFEHSKIVWRSFKILMDEGHGNSAENLVTGTRIYQDDLVRLAEGPAGFSRPGEVPQGTAH